MQMNNFYMNSGLHSAFSVDLIISSGFLVIFDNHLSSTLERTQLFHWEDHPDAPSLPIPTVV